MKRSLQLILGIALLGVAFSGVLTARELFASAPEATCPSPGPSGTVLGYPACVYGFFMYLAIAAVAAIGLFAGRRTGSGGGRRRLRAAHEAPSRAA